MRSVFYAFPLIGNTQELRRSTNLLNETWLLDVSDLPTLRAPTKKDGTFRRNRRHNAYVLPQSVTIRSDPVEAPLIPMGKFVTNSFPGMDGVSYTEPDSFVRFWDMTPELCTGSA